MENQIIPAIIAKSNKEMERLIDSVKEYVERIQLDFMDGKFVDNKSLDFNLNLPDFKGHYESHLMVKDPSDFIKNQITKIDNFIVHYESDIDLENIISYIKEKDKKVSIAINPDTKVKDIEKYINMIDMVLVMTVVPGFYGSKFLPEMLKKVKLLRKLRSDLIIEVDGGMNYEHILLAKNAGTNRFGSGSFIMKANNKKNRINKIRTLLD